MIRLMVVEGPHVGLFECGRERGWRYPFDEATQVGRQSVERDGVTDGYQRVAVGAEFDACGCGRPGGPTACGPVCAFPAE